MEVKIPKENIHDPGNTNKISVLWAVISVDAAGNEGICGLTLGEAIQPMVAGLESNLRVFEAVIPSLKLNTDKKIKLVKFTQREDIREY